MNILQILPELESGGVERGTVDLADALIQRGHKAVVVSRGGRLVEQLNEIGVKHYSLSVHKKSLITMISCIGKLKKILKEESIDIVHARSRVPAWIGFFASWHSGAAFITTCHGYYNTHFFSKVMGWGKRVIVISQVIGRHMINDFSVDREKIRLIYRGVKLSEFLFRPRSQARNLKHKRIGIIGRITPLKGHVHFIKSLPGIFSEYPAARALIIGEAPEHRAAYLEELKSLVKKLNICEKVEFLGNVENIPEILKTLDLLILATTTEEAFGRVVIEAGAVGVPVVATKVGGVVEIIEHEKEGLLVEPANPHAISEAAIRLLSDAQLADLMVQNLRKKVEDNFSLKVLVDKTIDVYKEASIRKKILVIKFGAFGDVVLISPALRALRERFPNADIELLIKNDFKNILQLCPYINNLVILRNKSYYEIWKKILLLREKNFDLSIDLQNNNISHIMAFAAGIGARFGYKNKKFGFLLNQGVKDTHRDCDPVTHQFNMLKTIGVDEDSDRNLEIWISEHDKESAQEFLKDNWHNPQQMLIGINALGSSRWISKIWNRESYAQLADMLANKFNARVVFTGARFAHASIEAIIAQTQCKPINAAGKTSHMQLAALIKLCTVLISVDSAPMHIAAAVGTPFVALFGPTDPARHLPYSEKSALIRKDLACSPCYSPRCFRKNCMREITVEEVFDAAVQLIGSK